MQNHLDTGATEQRSSEARKTIVIGTTMINTLIRSTLGPFGMTKLLTCEDKIKVTNDGATLLKNLVIDSASARILINASVSQDWEEGDGTTTIAILASLLVEEASKLEEIHPIQIIEGYEVALTKALEVLDSVCFVMRDDDMVSLAKTTLNSKILRCDLQKFAEICVNAINLIEDREDLNLINIIKTEGELQQSYLVDGFILDKDVIVPTLKNPRILVANTSMDTDKIKINGAQVNVRSVSELSQIEDAERQRMQEKVEKIVGAENGIDVFVNRQIIYDYFLQLFREKNVVAVEHADFEGVERLANVLGAKIMSTFDSLNDCIGTCERIENVHVGEKVMVKFSGLKKGACTIVLKGSTAEVLDEAERSVHDALCVLMRVKTEKKLVYGGGATEMEVTLAVNNVAIRTEGKESAAILAFANAVQKIPQIIAENGGFDGEAIKAKLRALHAKGRRTYGVDVEKGDAGCMKERSVVESLRIKRRIFTAAVEAASMIIKCDGLIKCKQRERNRE